MAFIASLQNARIKQIRALRTRKQREQTGLFFIEGIRIVTEAIQLQAGIKLLVVAPELLTSQVGYDIVRMQRRAGVPCLAVTAEVFKSMACAISLKYGPQGLGAVVRQRWEPLAQLQLSSEFCWVALDAVQDPGNLGTILRTCDAAGAAGIILLGQTTDPYDPQAVRASMGAILGQRLIRTSWTEFAAWKRQHGYVVIGTSGNATLDYRTIAYQPPVVLLMGNERFGLSYEQQALCEAVVKIPMVGRTNSLNLAVATGIMLYELFDRQQSSAYVYG